MFAVIPSTEQQSEDALAMTAVPPGPQGLDSLLLFNILRTNRRLTPFLDRTFQDLKLTSAQFNCLLALREEEDLGLPLGQIGRRLVVTKANVTGLIDRLEQRELVCREPTSDRRVVIARLTSRGLELVDRILPRHREALGEIMGCLSTAEKKKLIDLLTKLRRKIRQQFHAGNGRS